MKTLLLLLLLTNPILAQTPTIDPKVTIDSSCIVHETSLAIAPTAKMEVAISINGTGGPFIAYSFYQNLNPFWSNGIIPMTTISGWTLNLLDDPSVAVLDINDNFIVCARNPNGVYVNRFINQSFVGWERIIDSAVATPPIDKAWILSRTNGDLLITAFSIFQPNGGMVYARSQDFGATWVTEQVLVNGTGVFTAFGPQPALGKDNKVFVSWVDGDLSQGGHIRLLEGREGPNHVNFIEMRDSYNNQPIMIDGHIDGNPLPAPGNPVSKTVPFIAVDPTNEHRLYLAYQDVPFRDQSDTNVYLVKIQAQSDYNSWTVYPKVRINNDPVVLSPRPDQFLPSIGVDKRGRIHVIFYDNRNYYQLGATIPPTYDVYYAMSNNHGQSFQINVPLDNVPIVNSNFDPGEYNGIYVDNTKLEALIFTSYTGTDIWGNSNIYGSTIHVPW